MLGVRTQPSPRRRYDATAYRCARVVLADYSTSFSAGTRLLDARTRAYVESIYALVRIADEIVDTFAAQGPASPGQSRDQLEALRTETEAALERGWSTNVIVHAFVLTAARVGITRAETDPFFASMAMDLDVRDHDRASYERYVYGSAEVVGLMCLRAFLTAGRPAGAAALEPDDDALTGARALGAAFQKVNFLRDLGDDAGRLGRDYFPAAHGGVLDHGALLEILDEIEEDLALARDALAALPPRPRAAVTVTLELYTELFDTLSAMTPEEIRATRVRVPDVRKALVAGRAMSRSWLADHRD
ncbi:squalene/phytoene synthase family protein [Beutenbergia cavernae]